MCRGALNNVATDDERTKIESQDLAGFFGFRRVMKCNSRSM